MKTFREYLSISQFEDIWSEIVENYSEPEEIKSVYAKYYEKLKALPHKSVRGIIDMPGSPNQYPDGLNGAPDWIIDKRVKTKEKRQCRSCCHIALLGIATYFLYLTRT